jgi:Conserved TM helix
MNLEQLADLSALQAQLPHLIKALVFAILIALIAYGLGLLCYKLIMRLCERFALDDKAQTPVSKSLANFGRAFIWLALLPPLLKQLGLDATASHLEHIMGSFFAFVPKMISAAIILTVFIISGQLVRGILAGVFKRLKFDQLFFEAGINTSQLPQSAQPTTIFITLIYILLLLVGLMQASEALKMDALTAILVNLVHFLAQLILAGILFVFGLYVANQIALAISRSSMREAFLVARVARFTIMLFIGTMGLTHIGIAPDIAKLAFGLPLAALSLAFAIAVGFGAREAVGEWIRDWIAEIRERFRKD